MDFIKNLRKKIGHQKIIHPSARIIIENEIGKILFIKRKDNRNFGLPAGGLEENENIESCIIREVKEETGLKILNLELIGISSNPKFETTEYPNGDVVQYFTCEFYSNKFEGEIGFNNDEVSSASFLDFKNFNRLPENERRSFDTFKFYQKYGRVRIT